MLFGIIALILWVIIALFLKRIKGNRFKYTDALLSLVLVSYLITIDLGINYVAGAIPDINDGIGLHSRFAFYIIGEDGWSIDLFKKIYDVSFTISILLTFILIGSLLLNNRGSKS